MFLLITGSIKPENVPFLTIIDPNERLKQYIESISWYIEKSDIKDIVFCENTNYYFDTTHLLELAEKNNKNLEILQFKGNNTKVSQFGKGWGEGEIIKYCIENSEIVKNKEFFLKVTGRVIVKNIDKIISKIDIDKCYFIKLQYNMMSTVFYGTNIDLYNKYFLNGYNYVNDLEGYYLEKVFYDIIKKAERSLNVNSLPFYPKYVGISGSSGADYGEISLLSLIKKDIKCRLNIL